MAVGGAGGCFVGWGPVLSVRDPTDQKHLDSKKIAKSLVNSFFRFLFLSKFFSRSWRPFWVKHLPTKFDRKLNADPVNPMWSPMCPLGPELSGTIFRNFVGNIFFFPVGPPGGPKG